MPTPSPMPTPAPTPTPTPVAPTPNMQPTGPPKYPVPRYPLGKLVDCAADRYGINQASCWEIYNYYFYSFCKPLSFLRSTVTDIERVATGDIQGDAQYINRNLLPRLQHDLESSHFEEALSVCREISQIMNRHRSAWPGDARQYIRDMIRLCEYKIQIERNNFSDAQKIISELATSPHANAAVREMALADELLVDRKRGYDETYRRSYKENLNRIEDPDRRAWVLFQNALHVCSLAKAYNAEVEGEFRRALAIVRGPSLKAEVHIALATVLNKYVDRKRALAELDAAEAICLQNECAANVREQIQHYRSIYT